MMGTTASTEGRIEGWKTHRGCRFPIWTVRAKFPNTCHLSCHASVRAKGARIHPISCPKLCEYRVLDAELRESVERSCFPKCRPSKPHSFLDPFSCWTFPCCHLKFVFLAISSVYTRCKVPSCLSSLHRNCKNCNCIRRTSETFVSSLTLTMVRQSPPLSSYALLCCFFNRLHSPVCQFACGVSL